MKSSGAGPVRVPGEISDLFLSFEGFGTHGIGEDPYRHAGSPLELD